MSYCYDREIKFVLSTCYDEQGIKEHACVEVSVGGMLIPGIRCDTLWEAIKQFDMWLLNRIEEDR